MGAGKFGRRHIVTRYSANRLCFVGDDGSTRAAFSCDNARHQVIRCHRIRHLLGYADIRGFSRRVRPTIDDLPPGISQHLHDLFLQFKSFVVCTNRHDARFLWVLNRRLIIRRDQPHFLLPYQIAR